MKMAECRNIFRCNHSHQDNTDTVIVILTAFAVQGDKVFESRVDHPECPKTDPKGHTVMLPYPSDCTKFYMCNQGKAIPWLCPAGTHFNVKTSQCDWPKVAGCVATIPPPPPVDQEVMECPKVDPKDHTVMLPYPGDCNKFYVCNHGTKVPWNCPGGTHFNPKLSVCDWPLKAGCNQPPTPPPQPTTPPPPSLGQCPKEDPKDRTIMLPYPGDCTKFYMCNHGKAIPWLCPVGSHFNARTSLCDYPHAAGCTHQTMLRKRSLENECPKEDSKERTVMLPFPNDCTKFLMCNHGKPIPWLCPAGTHFNKNRAQCDWPHVAQCVQSPPTNNPPPLMPEITQCPREDPKDRTIMLPYPKDCSMFYMCNHGVAIPWHCPGGTHFNKKTSLCDWPHVAGCIQPPSPTPSLTTQPPPPPQNKCPPVDPKDRTIMLPYPGDCTKFYMCNHGKALPWSCPAGTHFNEKTAQCDWPHAAGCKGTPTEPNPSVTNAPPVKPGTGQCPKEDPKDRTIMLPFPGDCTKFYMCNHGKAMPWLCPAGTHFNEKTSLCDWPHVAGCMQKPVPKPSVAPPPVKPGTTQCPKEDPKDRTIMLPYPDDCSMFYMCDHGVAIPWHCPGGTHFNSQTSLCDWPHAAKCVQQPTPGPPPVTQPPPPPSQGKCPLVDPKDRTIMLPYPGDCTKFYMCNHGQAIPWSCPVGTHFNSKTAQCDWPRAAGCVDNTIDLHHPTTPRPPDNAGMCPKEDPKDKTIMLPFPGDCTKFYMCNHGKAIPWLCPAGTHFNEKTSLCDWPHVAGCMQKPLPKPPITPPPVKPEVSQCPKEDPKDKTIMLPYPGDCNKFYMCNHGTAISWNCPGGTHFNSKKSVCDWPHNAGCEQAPTSAPQPATQPPPTLEKCPKVDPKDRTIMLPFPGDCNKFFMCNHGQAIPWSCPAGTHFNARTSLCDWPHAAGCAGNTLLPPPVPGKDEGGKCPKEDPKDRTIMLPFPGDCTKFFMCNHGKAVPWLCPAGTHFNVKTSLCDWPHVAGCMQQRPTVAPPSPTTHIPPGNSGQCPKEDPKDRTIMLPFQGDCTKFYMCNHGKAIPWNCPGGTYFNAKLMACDWPSQSGCVQPTQAPPNPTITTPVSGQCPKEDPKNYTVMLPYPNDCSKFYMCNHGKAIPWNCPAGTHFNAKLSICDWPSKSGCVQPPTLPGTPPPPIVDPPLPSTCPKIDPKDRTIMFPYPGDCNKYFVCNHGRAVPWSCPAGTHFSPKLSVCVWPKQSGCVQDPPPPPQPKPDESISGQCPRTDFKDRTIMLPNPENCGKYYVCNHGKAIPWNCPAGTHFNKISSVCDWPASAGCAAAKPPLGQQPWKCPSKPPPHQPTRYLYSYPGNCNLFFMCLNGMAHVKTCPSNMHFNDNLMVCDWAHKAGCNI